MFSGCCVIWPCGLFGRFRKRTVAGHAWSVFFVIVAGIVFFIIAAGIVFFVIVAGIVFFVIAARFIIFFVTV